MGNWILPVSFNSGWKCFSFEESLCKHYWNKTTTKIKYFNIGWGCISFALQILFEYNHYWTNYFNSGWVFTHFIAIYNYVYNPFVFNNFLQYTFLFNNNMKDTLITNEKQIFFSNEIIFGNKYCNNILVCVLLFISQFKLVN